MTCIHVPLIALAILLIALAIMSFLAGVGVAHVIHGYLSN